MIIKDSRPSYTTLSLDLPRPGKVGRKDNTVQHLPPESRWHDLAKFSAKRMRWAHRARHVATLCRDDQWVCDIGCGEQHLRWLLPAGTNYLPADLLHWTEDTETCDLNAGKLPVHSLTLCDVAVMNGVVRYLRDRDAVFAGLAEYAEFLVIHYRPTDISPQQARRYPSHLSETELTALLTKNGFEILHRSYSGGRSRGLMLRLKNTRFDVAMAEGRAKARRQFISPRTQGWPYWRRVRSRILAACYVCGVDRIGAAWRQLREYMKVYGFRMKQS